MSASLPTNWDQLRRLAKQLETQCELSIATYARLAASISTSTSSSTNNPHSPSSLATIDRTQSTLQSNLLQLQQVIQQMTLILPVNAPSSHHHLIQRQTDVFNQHSREFRRIKSNLVSALEHVQLLSSVQSDIQTAKHAHSSDVDYFLSERSKLDSTHIMIDDVINQAHDTRTNLDSQRETLLGTHRRITNLHHTFPQLNSLMTRIRLRRRRDTIILSLLTASCLFLLFLYYT